MRNRFVVPAFFLCVPTLVGVACSSSQETTPPTVASGPVARFTLAADGPPAFMDVPFPSDAYIGSNGKVVSPVPGVEAVFKQGTDYLSHELGKANGFSRIAMAMFYVDDTSLPVDSNGDVAHADVDPASLPADEAACTTASSAVYFVDLAPSDPANAILPCRSFFHDDSRHLSKTRPLVTVGPARGYLLREGHKYAAVLTSRIKTKDGRAIAASADFAKVTSKTRDGAVVTAYGAAYDTVQSALAPLLAADNATIVSIAPYTTNNQTQELFKLRESLEDTAAPPLTWDAASVAPMGATKFAREQNGALPAGFTATLDAWLGVVDASAKLPDGTDNPDVGLPVRAHDKIDAVGTAVFVANNYLQSRPGSYQEVDHATFAYDASGNIIPAPDKPTTKIWVTVITPTAAMPAGGYPTVIVQHGLSGSRSYLLDVGNILAGQGWMVVGIDSVTFGARAAEPEFQNDASTDYSASPGATYKGPDGLADVNKSGARNGSSDLFGGLQNIGAIRDQFRAAGVDTAQLVRVLRANPDLSALKTGAVAPAIDPDRIAYLGDSLGAMEGIIAAAIEPNVKSWFLNVVGGGLFTELASHSPTISFQLAAAGGLFFGFNGDYFSESQPFVTMCQHLVDGGDPLSYAPYLVTSPGTFKGTPNKSKNILQTQVLFDEIVSNEANEAFMRAAGIGLATPNAGSNSGLLDLKAAATNPFRLPLTMLNPDGSGAFHDVPSAGVTAMAVQLSPAAHGVDLIAAKGEHQFAIPFARFNTSAAFTRLDDAKHFSVAQDYLGTEGLMTRFFADTFAGKVPSVSGFKAPVRDYDGDGAADDADADPSDPTVK